MDRYPHDSPDPGSGTSPTGDTGGIELLEDRTRPIAAGRRTARSGVSLPGAIAGAFLVAAIAFGAGTRATDPAGARGHDNTSTATIDQDDAGTPGAGTDLGHPDGAIDGTDGNPRGDADPTIDEPKDEPADEPVKAVEPSTAPEPTKTPAPEPAFMALTARLDGTKVVVKWGGCETSGFWAYKIVRSPGEAATWPLGTGDTVIGVVEDAATRSFVDAKLAAGTTYAYKVVALAKVGSETIVACRTETGRITTPEPPKPTSAPTTAEFGLAVSVVEGKILVDWTSCGVAGFDAYKVIRSKDATVTFPAGDYDQLIAAVGPDGDTAAWDKEVPGGATLYYRVFCVDKTEAGYAVVAATATKSVTTPALAPKPTPVVYTMGFDVQVTGEGVALNWEACGTDGFSYYKVLRSRSANPSYFPWADGTEVLAVIENAGTTTFVDNPPAGGTWYYRVQSIGHWDGNKVLLGQTPAESVTL